MVENQGRAHGGGISPPFVPPLDTTNGNLVRREDIWGRRLRWISNNSHPSLVLMKHHVSSIFKRFGMSQRG